MGLADAKVNHHITLETLGCSAFFVLLSFFKNLFYCCCSEFSCYILFTAELWNLEGLGCILFSVFLLAASRNFSKWSNTSHCTSRKLPAGEKQQSHLLWVPPIWVESSIWLWMMLLSRSWACCNIFSRERPVLYFLLSVWLQTSHTVSAPQVTNKERKPLYPMGGSWRS